MIKEINNIRESMRSMEALLKNLEDCPAENNIEKVELIFEINNKATEIKNYIRDMCWDTRPRYTTI